MPLPALHPLPNNPTTGQAPLASLRANGHPPASTAGGGSVSRETLKTLQDVAWSDDEDDPDCLLCAEPLDLSDLNFKPCQCGLQICQFCYNKLLNTDARCPGCRRPYDAKAVVFQPVDWEEVKRAKEKKTRRQKTIKQLTSLGRRHLLGVRVVMKNTVYVVGMKLPASGDEAVSILRSNDYFGQYGKISKLFLRDRTTLSSSFHALDSDEDAAATSTGILIIYVRREDAARAIMALDGIPAPQGPPGQTLKATFGTMRYCDSFLRGIKCDNQQCQNLHEWGGDSDSFNKEDYELALTRPAEYDSRQKQAHIAATPISQKSAWPKPSAIDDASASSALPNSAAWGKGIPAGHNASRAPPIGSSRPSKPPTSIQTALPLKSNSAFPLPTPSPVNPPPVKERKEKKAHAMSRGKSTDSNQSGTTGSAHPSPKLKLSQLATVNASKADAATAPPPGLHLLSGDKKKSVGAHAESPLEDESRSAKSSAGPSSSSPPPLTPSHYDTLPPPLTSDPIFVHSPYEEPLLYPFPSSDPEFVYIFEAEDDEAQRQLSQAIYQPSPFSKTLVGLAELGVLAPELPDLIRIPPIESVFSGTFQPFEPFDVEVVESGPSKLAEVEQGGPRTTSRFDFARPISRANSARAQSPFTMGGRRGAGDEWRGGQPMQGQGGYDDRHPLVASLVGSYGSPGSGEWNGQGHGHDAYATNGLQGERYGKARDRDEPDSGLLGYNPTPLQAANRLFSPEPATHSLDEFYPNGPQAFLNISPHGHGGHYDVRNLQYTRTQSPTPLSQSYRRFQHV